MTETPEIDQGPLTGRIGTWEGDKGLDVAPEPAGQVTNADSEVLSVVRYHQVVLTRWPTCRVVLLLLSSGLTEFSDTTGSNE